jgi:dolichol-phosphate mannosyltransferase
MGTSVTLHVDRQHKAAANCAALAAPGAVAATVILPAHNEAAALPTVLSALLVALEVALVERYEIIVVDDASTDETAAIASSYPCRLLAHGRKQGKGAAVRTGLRAARGRFIVVMDADNTYPADAVPRLIALSDQYDFVRSVRQYSAAHMPLVNRIGNRVFDTMLKLLCGLEGRDHLSGLYGLRREALQAMELTAEGFDLEVEIGIKAHTRRLRATSMPIAYGRRLGDKKLHAWRDGWRILRRALALAVHDHPHRPFVPPACSDDLPQCEAHAAGAICLLSTEDPRYQGA